MNTLFNETEEAQDTTKLTRLGPWADIVFARIKNELKKKSRKITNPRTILLEQAMSELEFPHEDFKKLLMQTKDFTEEEIREIWQKARAWKVNSRALFWKLIKEKRSEIKQQLIKVKQV